MGTEEPSEEPFDINSEPKEIKFQPLPENKAPGKKPIGAGCSTDCFGIYS
jgi:coatomer protein complex subunit gamma